MVNSRAMGKVLLGALSPHPPLLVPEVGKDALGDVEQTRQAMVRLAQAVRDVGPDVVVVISPHGPMLPDGVGIWAIDTLEGDFEQFGAGQVGLSFPNDLELLEALLAESESLSYTLRKVDGPLIRTYRWSPQLDYATLVPLYYLDQVGVHTPILAVGMGFLPPRDLYEFGVVLRKAIEKTGRKAVVIASGDLSHRLTCDAPAGYSPKGKIFDETLWGLLGQGDIQGILDMDIELLKDAGECGYRSLVMLLGCWDTEELATMPLSYEGPFGVGYGVCMMHSVKQSIPTSLAAGMECGASDFHEHPLIQLARQTVEALARSEALPLAVNVDLPEDLPAQAGVFVSLKKRGELRGCIGTISPTQPNLAQEVIHVARQASTADPRFSPVEAGELEELSYSVDVLGSPEPVSTLHDLDPQRFGVIVEAGSRKGLLLPDLQGIDSAAQQVAIARNKAGIKPGEDVQLFRFGVRRYQ